MTAQEAIKWIRLDIEMAKFDPTTGEEAYLNDDAKKVIEAQEMAINALEAWEQLANNSPKLDSKFGELINNKRTDKRTETHACDYISRQDVIDKLKREEKILYSPVGAEYLIRAIEDLPSAQPERRE